MKIHICQAIIIFQGLLSYIYCADSGNEHEILNSEVRTCYHDELGLKQSVEGLSGINKMQGGDDYQKNYLQLLFYNEMKLDTSTKQGYNLYQYVTRLTNVATSYFKQFLLLKQRKSAKLKFPIDMEKCQLYTVDKKYKTDDSENAHLIIFLTKENYTDIPKRQFIWGAACLHNSDGPLFAQLNFDNEELASTNYSDYRFAIDLQSLMHQIFHILGFSSTLYTNWANGMFDKDTMMLNTPKVQSTTKNFYSLDSLSGMPLEDTTLTGTFSSHWRQVSLKGDLMNQFFEPQPNISLSELTISLLEDTNWYEVPLSSRSDIRDIQWGKNGGYSFIDKSLMCKDATRKEFCGIDKPSDVDKGFEEQGYGTCQKSTYSQGCQFYDVRLIDICWNPFNSKDIDNKSIYSTGQIFNWNSKVLESNYQKQGSNVSQKNFRCFPFTCQQSQNGDWFSVTIQIEESISQICTVTDEDSTMQINNGSTSNSQYWIKCPKSIANFCSQNQQCPQFCGQKGLCVNGKCVCQEKYNRMEVKRDPSGQCVVSNCENGYFDGKLQKCMDCALNCAHCEYSKDICTECAEDYYMDSNGSCRGQCSKGWYGDKQTKMCLRCSSNCSECSNVATECTACYDQYTLKDDTCEKQTTIPDDGTNNGGGSSTPNSSGKQIVNFVQLLIGIAIAIIS